MATVELIYYQEADGAVPVLRWFDTLSSKAIQKCHVRLERLEQFGHELRRPEADYLRDGVYELRAGYRGVPYRMLYFFHGRAAVVVSHGLVKEKAVMALSLESGEGLGSVGLAQDRTSPKARTARITAS